MASYPANADNRRWLAASIFVFAEIASGGVGAASWPSLKPVATSTRPIASPDCGSSLPHAFFGWGTSEIYAFRA